MTPLDDGLGAVARSHLLADAFRAIMEATAMPGAIRRPPPLTDEPAPLSPAAAAVVIALTDSAAPLWLAPTLAADGALIRRLRFATGAGPARTPAEAAFALGDWPALRAVAPTLSAGDPERPDLSATLVVEIEALSEAPRDGALGLSISGPGVPPEAPRRLWLSGAPEDLLVFHQAHRPSFPVGFDMLLTAGDALAALPRSVFLRPISGGGA